MNIYISDVGIYRSDNNSYPFTNTASVKKVEPLEQTKSSTDSVVRQAQQAYVAENTPAYTISISSMGKAAVQSLQKLSANFASLRDQQSRNNIIGFAAENDNSQKSSLYDAYDERESFTTVDASKSLNAGFTGTESVGVSALAGPSETSAEPAVTAVSDEIEETSSASSNLSRYTDYQLQQLLNDGSISRAEYNTELAKRTGTEEPQDREVSEQQEAVMQDPVMRQAVAAYNFQMAYQINALITQ